MDRPTAQPTGATAVADRRDARDTDFAAYLAARQPSLLRTAYLLTGNRHDAEDLVQTAFAKLYLSWDKVRDHGAIDGYVRRILVNEHNSLWRRAWKRREHSAEDWLPKVDVPVLVIAGERDTFTPASLSEFMVEQMPQAELLMVKGGTHVAPIEQPELIAAKIKAFIERVATS